MSVDTAHLRALLAAATPVPWTEDDGSLYGPNGGAVAHIAQHVSMHTVLATGENWRQADAALIAAAVNALPGLLDELDALRAELDVERLKPLLDFEASAQAWQTRAELAEAELTAWRNATHSATPADLSASVAQSVIDHVEMQSAWKQATGCDTPEEAQAAREAMELVTITAEDVARMQARDAELARLRELEAAVLAHRDACERVCVDDVSDDDAARQLAELDRLGQAEDAAIAACRKHPEGR